jgi:hypothetical protein
VILSKDLEGATVERIYWAVPSKDWLPVIGDQFDSFNAAKDHADALMVRDNMQTAIITSRMVFRQRGVSIDLEVARERRFR